ncbi:hypothetical protein BpHYR1_040461 [Brachionus plicatilis]|uniref:Uncharacterized protein n=1 Tax=Brachionus plicatilis TaxID=10195 RepID=A0A3M7REF0_BRAPC|nr:hypothetical protein BpHYR1_040461 [Brachionus plicatilis]
MTYSKKRCNKTPSWLIFLSFALTPAIRDFTKFKSNSFNFDKKAFIQAFVDIDARIDELNAQKPKKDHNFRISNLNTVDRIIYCASSDSLLCKVRHKIGFCHLGSPDHLHDRASSRNVKRPRYLRIPGDPHYPRLFLRILKPEKIWNNFWFFEVFNQNVYIFFFIRQKPSSILTWLIDIKCAKLDIKIRRYRIFKTNKPHKS